MHGQPDFGMYQIAQTIYRLADMGELATRLGSIVTHDRRGDVIWLDDFEGGIAKWLPTPWGLDAVVEWSADRSRNRGFSLKLIAGSTLTHSASVDRILALPALSKLGLEFAFSLEDTTEYLELYGWLYDGAKENRFFIRYNIADKTLEYTDHEAYWKPFATEVKLYAFIQTWHIIKLVFDAETGYYTRVILDDAVYDLSAYKAYAHSSKALPQLAVTIKNIGRDEENDIVYVDDFIATQNEPA